MSSELHPMNDPAHADHYRRDDNRHDWAVRVVRNHARDPQALATAATILLSDYEALKPATVAHLVGKGGVIEERACVTCDQPYPAYTVESTSKCYACRALATVAGSPDLTVSVLRSDVTDIIDILEQYVDCPEVWAPCIARLRLAAPSRVAPPWGAQLPPHVKDCAKCRIENGCWLPCRKHQPYPASDEPASSPLPRATEPEAYHDAGLPLATEVYGFLEALDETWSDFEVGALTSFIQGRIDAALSSAPPVVRPERRTWVCDDFDRWQRDVHQPDCPICEKPMMPEVPASGRNERPA